MKSVVRPELPTASVGSSQAPTAAVDNSAPLLTTPESTYKSRKSVQTTGATSVGDYPYSEIGSPQNAELVKKVAAMARQMGREVATPAEAHKMLGIA
jgi:hypothetical protein